MKRRRLLACLALALNVVATSGKASDLIPYPPVDQVYWNWCWAACLEYIANVSICPQDKCWYVTEAATFPFNVDCCATPQTGDCGTLAPNGQTLAFTYMRDKFGMYNPGNVSTPYGDELLDIINNRHHPLLGILGNTSAHAIVLSDAFDSECVNESETIFVHDQAAFSS